MKSETKKLLKVLSYILVWTLVLKIFNFINPMLGLSFFGLSFIGILLLGIKRFYESLFYIIGD